MKIQKVEGVTADICESHGVWLRTGELESILLRLRFKHKKRRREMENIVKQEGKMSGMLFGWWAFLFEEGVTTRQRNVNGSSDSTASSSNSNTQGDRFCPVCDKTLEVQEKEGISIDVCAEHGIWFDQGELKAIVKRLKSKLVKEYEKAVDKARNKGILWGTLFGWLSLLRNK